MTLGDSLLYCPNILLISGSGRNTGKTTLACALIEKFSKRKDIIGLKFSKHIHEGASNQNVFSRSDRFTIVEEILITKKDSSRMLQAGAEKVYYIQSEETGILNAFNVLLPHLENKLVICESGGLYRYIKPGLLIFLSTNDIIPENKRDILAHNPIRANVFKDGTERFINRIEFSKGKFFINNLSSI